MIGIAHLRGFEPDLVLFDSWFSGNTNIHLLISLGWNYFSRLKSNRLINVGDSEFKAVKELPLNQSGSIVSVKNLGLQKCFKSRSKSEKDCFWFTNILDLDITKRKEYQKIGWKIEQYHRDIKGCCGIEKCQCRSACAQINHILCSLCAFIQFEVTKAASGKTCYQAKRRFIKDSVSASRQLLYVREYLSPMPLA